MSAAFTVHRRLGAGGFGEVQLASMKKGNDEALVALKRVRADLAGSAEYTLQFEREAKLTSLLDHPNVVRLLDFGADGAGPYLALEFVHGRPSSAVLDAFLERSERVPIAVALTILRDAARGLVYAHHLEVGETVGLIHRDLSPDNVLVGFDGESKLSDFGIARGLNSTRMTATGAGKGKLGFMAPELLDGAAPSFRSDLFAFAVTAYELISGVNPFAGKTEAEIIARVLKCNPVPLAARCSDVPPEVEAWVTAALKRNPEARPESAVGALHALEDYCGHWPDEGRAEVRKCLKALWEKEAAVKVDALLRDPTPLKDPRKAKKKKGGPSRGDRLAGAAAVIAIILVPTVYLLGQDLSFLHKNAQRLADEQFPSSRPSSDVDVVVESEPPGATVQLEGVPQPQKTPMVLSHLRRGQEYRVDVYLDGFYAWSETVVAKGQSLIITLKKLKP
jgi:eukaryotic-like serine/threonine-protein kinase